MTASATANGLLSKPAYNDPLWHVQANQNWDNIDAALHGRNMLMNSAFLIDQINLGASTAVSDDNYAFDGWNILTQTASINVAVTENPEAGYRRAMKLTQSQASAQRMGFQQIIAGMDGNYTRSGPVVLSGRIKCSASTPIRYAILEWTGTEDSVISDIVNNWTSGTFTTGNFFNSTTLALIAIGSLTPSAATWTALTALTGTVSASCNNLIVFVWTENTQAQNVTLECDALQLEPSAVPSRFERKSRQAHLMECYRDVQVRTFGQKIGVGNASTAAAAVLPMQHIIPMRTTPNMTIPAAGTGSGQAAFFTNDLSGSTPGGATNTAVDVDAFGFTISGTGYVSLTAGSPSMLWALTGAAKIIAQCRL